MLQALVQESAATGTTAGAAHGVLAARAVLMSLVTSSLRGIPG
jgi:hypothetical protein